MMLAARANKTHAWQVANCTIETCPISSSYYYYRVSLPANATFLALFAISLIGFLATYALTRRALAFHFALLSGVILEVIGYAGRIQSYQNQWNQNGFLIQIVCLTIAPAFMAGGIYLSLRRVVYAFGPENSRISPEAYTRIVSCPSPFHINETNLLSSSSHVISSPWCFKPQEVEWPPSPRIKIGASRQATTSWSLASHSKSSRCSYS